MKVAECVTRVEVVPSGHQGRLWDVLVLEPVIKERLMHQALLSLSLRQRLPFEATALHGLITLYGPPGTGKTTLARGLAAQLAPFVPGKQVRRIEVNPHGLMSAEHGQSQQRVSELLAEYVPALAGTACPTVVVLDEVESMAVARSRGVLAANPADVHRATDAVLTALDDNARRTPEPVLRRDQQLHRPPGQRVPVPLGRRDPGAAAGGPTRCSRSSRRRSCRWPGLTRRSRQLADRLRCLAASPPAGGVEAWTGPAQVRLRGAEPRLETVLNPGKLTGHDLVAAADGRGQAHATGPAQRTRAMLRHRTIAAAPCAAPRRHVAGDHRPGGRHALTGHRISRAEAEQAMLMPGPAGLLLVAGGHLDRIR